MEKTAPIGVIDSGVGGLTVAKQLMKALPNEEVIYFADSANMPYGNRSKEEIIGLASKMINFVEEKNVKAVLVACNTISSFIDEIKSETKLISIVKAGVDEAARESEKNECVGVMATKATVESRAYEKENERTGNRLRLITNASVSLPKVIDRELENTSLLTEKIRECVDPIMEKDASITKLILGCSHFPIIKEEISALYPHLTLIDPAMNQVEVLRKYLRENNALNNNRRAGKIMLYTSGCESEFELTLQKIHMKPVDVTVV